ncbi:MAG: DUF2017 family protein [Planctomycetes bacterium]|nr:DUF2017 family protein [Planctomycetota bacterium]
MQVLVDLEGNMEFRGLPPLFAETLFRLPEVLRDDDPAVRQRLLPNAYEDEDDAEQWRKYALPEIEHLYLGRIEIVEQDLTSLREIDETEFAIRIPVEHRYAWLSALNAARLSMFITGGFTAEDMEAEVVFEGLEEDLTLLKIHYLAFMQQMLLEAGGFDDA